MKKLFVALTALLIAIPQIQAAITVNLMKPSWSKVNVYAWDASGNPLVGAWPGKTVTKTKSFNGYEWYSVTFAQSVTSANVIFNNGTDQTVNIEGITSTTYYKLDSTSGTEITVTNFYEGTTNINASPITVYSLAPEWSKTNIYAWDNADHTHLGAWPGSTITTTKAVGANTWTYCTFPAGITPMNVIFNNGTSQTDDITGITEDSYYVVSGTTATRVYGANSTVSFNKASGSYASGTSVTMSISNCSNKANAKIIYTTDGSTPSLSNGKQVSSGSKLTLSKNVVVKACVVEAGVIMSEPVTATYTISCDAYTVYFKDPSWNFVYVYAWDDAGTRLIGDWPGTKITSTKTIGCNKWYYYTFSTKPVNIIFNDANGKQTNDLEGISAETYFALTSGTTASKIVGANSSVAFSKASGTYDKGTTVTMSISNIEDATNAKIIYTTDGSTPTASNGTQVSNGATYTINNAVTLKAVVSVSGIVMSNASTATYKVKANATPVTPVTVYVKKPSTWTTLYYYAWDNDGNKLLGEWPGTAITTTSTINNVAWNKYTFSNSPVNIIINNGTDKTVDITGITSDTYYVVNAASGQDITVSAVDPSTISETPGDDSNAWPSNYAGVMLQGFYWDSFDETNWAALTSQSDELSQYFDLIWVPNSGKSSWSPSMGYDPVYWMSNHNSSFGSESELRNMIKTFKSKGTGIIEDVVINHRAGVTNWTDFPTETYKGVTYSWGPWAICCTDEVNWVEGQEKPTGAADTGDDFNGFRDLDHTNAQVRAGIKAYLDFLKNDLGYIGWRYDMVKGYSPCYNDEYNRSAGAHYSVGEYWDANFDAVANWIRGTNMNSAAFDFPFKFALNEAMASGDYSKLCWKRYGTLDQPCGLIHDNGFQRYSVTFVDNHDTYRDCALPNNVMAANAFMLMMPGTPCVFWPHWRDNKEAIKALIDVRKAAGITNQSEVRVLRTNNSCFCAEVYGTNGTVAVKIGPEFYTPDGWSNEQQRASGYDYCVWSTVSSSTEKVGMSLESGKYPYGTEVTLSVNEISSASGKAPSALAAQKRGGLDDFIKIVYTIDNSTPTLENGNVVDDGYTLPLYETTTITAGLSICNLIVLDLYSETYEIGPKPLFVYLRKPDWEKVYLYAWADDETEYLGAWPGKEFTKTVQIGGFEWIKCSLPEGVSIANVIFNDGSAQQTTDITGVNKDTFYTLNGVNTDGKYVPLDNGDYSGIGTIATTQSVKVYPNPATTSISVSRNDVARFSAYTTSGTCVATSNDNTLDVNGLSNGIYIYRIDLSNGISYHGKFVKQ